MDREETKHIIIDYIDLNLERVNKTFAKFFKDEHGLSPNQMSVIWYLRKRGRMTMSECADTLHMCRQQATRLIETMVEKNMVERVYSKENRRIIWIVLAPDGLDVIHDVEGRYVENFVRQCDLLAPKEQEAFFNAVSTINRMLPVLYFGPPGEKE